MLAIAAGAVIGAGLGASAQAAMVTRGFVELRRIGAAFGARPETLMGLSGLGDLLLTCASAQSRNFAYGLALGRGEDLAGRPLAEGVATAAIAARIARERGIDAPIIAAVAQILDGAITIGEAVAGADVAAAARPKPNRNSRRNNAVCLHLQGQAGPSAGAARHPAGPCRLPRTSSTPTAR